MSGSGVSSYRLVLTRESGPRQRSRLMDGWVFTVPRTEKDMFSWKVLELINLSQIPGIPSLPHS